MGGGVVLRLRKSPAVVHLAFVHQIGKLRVGLAQDQRPVMRDVHLPQRFDQQCIALAAARRAAVTITVDEGSDESAENIFSAMLAADTFHTFAEWKRMGYSVKKGQHAALTCQLWKYTDKPGKAAREAAAHTLTPGAEELPETGEQNETTEDKGETENG